VDRIRDHQNFLNVHASGDVEYLLYSGRCEYRGGDTPESVVSGNVRMGNHCGGSFILHPSSLSETILVPASFPLFSFFGGLHIFFKLRASTYRLMHLL